MFDARKTLADLALEPFAFSDMAGKVHHLPHMKSLTSDAVERINKGEILNVMLEVIGEQTWAAINAMPVAVMSELAADWVKHSEAKPGESSASSRSSASTPGPSRQTSRSAASKTRKR